MAWEFITNLINSYPNVILMLVSVVITFISLLITKLFTNQDRMKELKELQKSCQIKLKDHKGNPVKQMEIQKQMMECSAEMMKISFKPLLITFIPFLLLFIFLSNTFGPRIPGKWLFPIWVWYYLITSIVANIFLRKVMKVY